MSIEKGILGLKLVTGEDIVAKVGQTSGNEYILSNPVLLRMMPSQIEGTLPQVGFVPFPMLAQQKKDSIVIIDDLHVVYTYIPDEQIVRQYDSIFGSGIITAQNQIITG
jgi:hypothetical protein